MCSQLTLSPKGKDMLFYAADILDRVSPKFHELGVTYECIGGGRISHDGQAKTLNVYGYSVVRTLITT